MISARKIQFITLTLIVLLCVFGVINFWLALVLASLLSWHTNYIAPFLLLLLIAPEVSFGYYILCCLSTGFLVWFVETHITKRIFTRSKQIQNNVW